MRFAPKPSDAPVKVEVTKAPALDAMRHKLNETIMAHAHAGTLSGYLTRHHHPLGDSSALRASISNSRGGDFNRQGDTFHVHGVDVKTGLAAAEQVSARRDGQDRIRYGQGSIG